MERALGASISLSSRAAALAAAGMLAQLAVVQQPCKCGALLAFLLYEVSKCLSHLLAGRDSCAPVAACRSACLKSSSCLVQDGKSASDGKQGRQHPTYQGQGCEHQQVQLLLRIQQQGIKSPQAPWAAQHR